MADKREVLFATPQLTASVIVDNDYASRDLVTEPDQVNTGGQYLYMEKLMVSIVEPSHGNGVLELRDSRGLVKWRTNTDGVKDLNLNFGRIGMYMGQNTGLKAVVSGSGGEQANVSVMFMGYRSKHKPQDPAYTVAQQHLQST